MQAYRPKPSRATKLDANETPDILTDRFREALAARVRTAPLNRYPTAGALEIKEALCMRFGGEPKEYVVGCGSDEIICLVYLALSKPRDGERVPSVVFPDPSFVMYQQNALTYGWAPYSVSLRDDWSLPVGRMIEAIEDCSANLAFVDSPNNPTGSMMGVEELKRLCEGAPASLVVVDQAYAAFADPKPNYSEGNHPNLALMGTLSKQGLAGIRLGWLRADARLVEQIEKARQPFNVPLLTRMAASLALGEFWDDFSKAARDIRDERQRLAAELSSIDGLRVFPSQANFLLVRIDDALERRQAQLDEAGIGLRSFPADGRLENHYRITVGTRDENQLAARALR
jgi:histidinol-phosphate aminotransferase